LYKNASSFPSTTFHLKGKSIVSITSIIPNPLNVVKNLAHAAEEGLSNVANTASAAVSTSANALKELLPDSAVPANIILQLRAKPQEPTAPQIAQASQTSGLGKPAEGVIDTSKHNGFGLGAPQKPEITWDEDFKYGSASANWRDYLAWGKWQAELAGARMLTNMDDATQMYAHYLDNTGDPIRFDYEEAYLEDENIRSTVDTEIARAQQAAQQFIESGQQDFQITGEARATTQSEYPETENWQKAIGGHQVWTSADVKVEGDIATMTVTVHAEDHYNFNRDQEDIATGTSDNENGRFTEIGWAKPFDSHGEVVRTITWNVNDPPSSVTAPTNQADPERNLGREDRVDGRHSGGGTLDRPESNRDTGRFSG
jgi:hypothetical protein